MNTMQITDVETPLRTTPQTRAPYVIQVIRPKKVASPAMYKPLSKWTVVAAFILAVAVHIGAVAFVGMKGEQTAVKVAQTLEGSVRPGALD